MTALFKKPPKATAKANKAKFLSAGYQSYCHGFSKETADRFFMIKYNCWVTIIDTPILPINNIELYLYY